MRGCGSILITSFGCSFDVFIIFGCCRKLIIFNIIISHRIGTSIRGGRGGMTPRRGSSNSGSYNSNINVTGSDVQQCKYRACYSYYYCTTVYSTEWENFFVFLFLLASSPPSKPFYRGGLSRGRGGFQGGPSRPNGPMQIAPSHQPGMMQPGGRNDLT